MPRSRNKAPTPTDLLLKELDHLHWAARQQRAPLAQLQLEHQGDTLARLKRVLDKFDEYREELVTLEAWAITREQARAVAASKAKRPAGPSTARSPNKGVTTKAPFGMKDFEDAAS